MNMSSGLTEIIERDRAAVKQGYVTGDVNNQVQPVIGILRMHQHNSTTPTDKQIEYFITALTKACNSEIALLAFLHPEKYQHVH